MTDKTPDFDSMSPEELMAWMESLAKRQGANEGFTTAADMEVAEIDPSSVALDEPGYIPYGMDPEKWAQKQAEEERIKAERRAAQPAPAPTPAAAPPPPAVTPVPAAAPPPPPQPAPAPAPAAAAQPDFDNMSPEELMAWMETLAKRQGADEGFTTSADMAVAEIDPSMVQLDEPGYIPYGMDADKWAQKQAEEERRKAERRAAQTSTPPAAAPTPPPPPQPAAPAPQLELFGANDEGEESTRTTPSEENALSWLENLAVDQGGGADLPAIDLSALSEPLPDLSGIGAANDDPMAWLESLSQSQSSIPGLDQFNLEDIAAPTTPPAPSTVPADQVPAAPSSDNPLEWLESLARRQGADSEELMTDAALDIPVPDASQITRGPGYTEYTFEGATNDETPDALSFLEVDEDEEKFDLDDNDDTSDWLTALATGQLDEVEDGEPQAASPSNIQEALAQGADIPADAMKNWMDQLLEQGAARNDVADYEDDEPAQLVPAKLPDWLIEQVGAPPEIPATPSLPGTKPLVDQIVEPPEVDMPDWLKEDIEDTEAVDFDSIFATEDEPEAPVVAAAPPEPATPAVETPKTAKISTSELEMDVDDPWVEAFEFERKHSKEEMEKVPDWYAEKLRALGQEPQIVENVAQSELDDEDLMDVELPVELELAEGQPQDVPSWLNLADIPAPVSAPRAAPAPTPAPAPAAAPVVVESEPEEVISSTMPDWLREQMPVEEEAAGDLPLWLREAGVDTEDEIEIPAWLTETLDTGEVIAVETPPAPTPAPAAASVTPPPAPTPAYTPPPAPVSPAPVSMVVANINVEEVLGTARAQFKERNIDAALQNYEAVVRANAALDAVVEDLSAAIKEDTHKSNPAIYRVLGDGYMRLGKLQQALDTYRKALNLL